MRNSSILALISTTLIAISLATGCGSSSTQARLLNAFPSTTTLDMLIDSKNIATGIAYGGASGYGSVSSGSRHLQVEPTGTSSPLFDQNISLSSGSKNTVLATNSGVTVFTDNDTAPASGDISI